jgi:hypothetical protein
MNSHPITDEFWEFGMKELKTEEGVAQIIHF